MQTLTSTLQLLQTSHPVLHLALHNCWTRLAAGVGPSELPGGLPSALPVPGPVSVPAVLPELLAQPDHACRLPAQEQPLPQSQEVRHTSTQPAAHKQARHLSSRRHCTQSLRVYTLKRTAKTYKSFFICFLIRCFSSYDDMSLKRRVACPLVRSKSFHLCSSEGRNHPSFYTHTPKCAQTLERCSLGFSFALLVTETPRDPPADLPPFPLQSLSHIFLSPSIPSIFCPSSCHRVCVCVFQQFASAHVGLLRASSICK